MTDTSRSLLGLRPAVLAAAGLAAYGLSAGTSLAAPAAAPVKNGASQVSIKLTGNTCKVDHSTAKAGPVTFRVTNVSATGITEVELLQNLRIVGERENLAPGLPASSFTVTLDGGRYTVYCPGGKPENQPFTVTGKAAPSPGGSAAQLLAAGTKSYAAWVSSQAEAMRTAVNALAKAVNAGNLSEAKKNYVLARPFYEKIESDVDGFVMPGFKATDNHGNLDYLIDMRASNIDKKVGWSGFHAVERDLYQRGAITSKTKSYANALKANVGTLVTVVKKLSYKPEDLGNGAAGLLEEVQANKITGEEEAYSHIDLVDFSGNLEGAQQAFANLQPGLAKIDKALAATVDAQFTKARDALNAYRDASSPGGYIAWTTTNRKKYAKKLSRAVLALQRPLQRIAQKVATGT
ncbi:MAG TPA: iron uptake system protein EfeO [Solirubrobacteraceae bacterium]|jgi:iron uptake system component EfeO|nr:iron uptake system protein EfeO [Solirubrobacteraceae bacterium]